MADLDFDIFISGGGIAGLVAAVAFGTAGHTILLADPAPVPHPHQDSNTDPRSTAFLLPSQALLEKAGLWSALEEHSTPLNGLRVVDTNGWPPKITESRLFLPDDLNETTFGWNIPNSVIRTETIRIANGLSNIELVHCVGFRSMLTRTDQALVTLTNGRRLRVRLVVAADGHRSPVREAAGIGTETTSYGQKALAFEARHSLPHQCNSIEIYNEGGAFTTVPLPDTAGEPASAIVWMNYGTKSQALSALPELDFNAEMTLRSCGLLGPMERAGPVRMWPVITQKARRMTAERTALIAEAAHVLPPIGAQGLNTSLRDVALLLDIAETEPCRLGSSSQLSSYEKSRSAEISLFTCAIDLFNRTCMSSNPGVRLLRRGGLAAVHDLVPLRRAIMRAGIGGLDLRRTFGT